jgi:PAS domain S-box-containing protein
MGDIYTSSAAKPRLLVMLEQVSAHLQKAQNAVTTLHRNFADRRRRPREALRARESNMQKLLASSLDAIVVTNRDRGIVEANREALNLFGVSESNMRQFTINAFISDGEILDFNGKRSPFIKREERYGKCQIRRLDGSSRVAEYVFTANILPRRHLYRFLNVSPQKVTQVGVTASIPKKHWEINPPNEVTQQAQFGVSHLYQKVAHVNMPSVSATDATDSASRCCPWS